MKIAIVFLLLGISSFIDTSNGNGTHVLKKLTPAQAIHYGRCLAEIAVMLEHLNTSPPEEIHIRKQFIAEKLLLTLCELSVDIDCTLEKLLGIQDLTDSVISHILAGDVKSLLAEVEVCDLVSSVSGILEGVLAIDNVLLKDLLVFVSGSLGLSIDLTLLGPLHNRVPDVLASITGTWMGAMLGLEGGVLGSVGDVLGGLGI